MSLRVCEQIRDKISEEIADMNFEEMNEYFQKHGLQKAK